MRRLLSHLETGPSYRFAAWPVAAVPAATAGVYTIWDADRLIYVGMSGRALTADSVAQVRLAGKRVGLWNRLNAHASGARSGDQFCVYVADHLVLPSLTGEQVRQIGEHSLSMDALTRAYIRDRFSFRFVETADGRAAFDLETAVQRGALAAGKPLLNPA